MRSALQSSGAFVALDVAQCDRPIHYWIERQASRRPDAVAVRLATGDISYAALNAAANRVAGRLLDEAAVAGKPVALMLDQGYESIVWTLAILKAGLAYAPLDQRLPGPVLRDMIDDLEPCALVAGARYRDAAAALPAKRFPVIAAELAHEHADGGSSCANLDRPIPADSIAYVFYTSGSTGIPKGVADAHRNVLHNVLRYTNTLRFSAADTLSLIQNPSFSGTVSTLFGALVNGAAVAPFDLHGQGIHALSAWLKRARVTVFHGVPSIFRRLSDPADRFPDVRLIRLEGDRSAAPDLQHFRANFRDDCTLVNGLGATECGLARQFFVDRRTNPAECDPVPIGYPVPGVEARVVDEQGRSVAPGSIGEIVVESAFLATGYWRNPALTRERFSDLGRGIRRYRTGDLGRMDADGCLVHLGRVDHGIRIAGRFVDPGAIESALLGVSGVRQSAVRDYVDRAGERRLCAYVVADANAAVTVDRLRAALSERIARHALPTAFVFLGALPLTKDLKVDFGALPQPDRQRPTLPNDYVPARTEFERTLARIWSEVLEIDAVGVTDSFFELGGDSLRAAQVASRLHEQHGIELEVASVFEHMTIAALAGALEGARPARAQPATAPSAPSTDPGSWPRHSIAVIGMAGRFPGANSIDGYWRNLREARESVTFFRPEELDRSPQSEREAEFVAARGLIPDADMFDAPLFGLTPRQAAMLDPQQRVWLECVHDAMEDAGLPVGRRHGADDPARVGVFAGARESTYLLHLVGGNPDAVDALLHRSSDEAYQLLLGNDHDSIATRTSFLLDLTGPSVNVQSACSTSLVAVALACDALVSGQCDVAVAGGVAVTFPQKRSYRVAENGIQSRDGHCRPFDAAATGTVFSDGAGAIVLKRLQDALTHGDRIDAIIRGWAVNNDGAGKASFTAPTVAGQAQVIERAQDHAGIAPHAVTYVETHGTGTLVGDPIEFAALERAFRRGTQARGFCGLGSVKSNIGHLDTAAGIAGLIKTVLALEHREIPPTLHFRTPNPQIRLADSPFYIAERLRPWTAETGSRIAGVSSLGVGGTNCHVVVQEAPAPGDDHATGAAPPHLLTLSAASDAALDALESRFERFLIDVSDADLAAVAAATQKSRSHYPHRSAIVGSTAAEMRQRLMPGRAGSAAGRFRGRAGRAEDALVGFLFTGQGSQYAGMGRALYEANADFRRLLQRCDGILRSHLERPLLDVMFGEGGEEGLVHRTDYAQPALVALECSLAELLRSWGIVPRFVIGHSIGEYAAAFTAGVFGLEDALVLAAGRGRLMQQLPGSGAMLAVGAPPESMRDVLPRFAEAVSIAAINAPRQIVLAGESDAIHELQAQLRTQGIRCRELRVAHAFHSPQMTPVLEPLQQLAGRVELRRPALRYVSALHGRTVGEEVADPAYWRDQAVKPVQFAAGIGAMTAEGCALFVEIGPDEVLAHLAREADPVRQIEAVPTLCRGRNDLAVLLEAVGCLYVRGTDIDSAALRQRRAFRPPRLPTYPFQRSRHWYTGSLLDRRSAGASARASASHPLLGRRLSLPGSAEIRFENRFSETTPTFVGDHRLFGVPIPPGASHFAMLAQAAEVLADGDAAGGTSCRYEDLCLLRPLLLPDGCEREVQLIFRSRPPGFSVELTSAELRDGAASHAWTTHMTGRVRSHGPGGGESDPQLQDVSGIKARCGRQVSAAEFYLRIWANQGGTGSAFRWIDAIWQGEGEALCHAAAPASVVDAARYRLHPGLIEAACQVLHCCTTIETRETLERNGATYVPFSVEAFRLFEVQTTHEDAWCHARLRERSGRSVVADLSVLAASGKVVARLEGFCLRPIAREAVCAPDRHARPLRTEFVAAPIRRRGAPDDSSNPASSAPQAARSPPEVLLYLCRQCAELSGRPEAEIRASEGFLDSGLDSLAAATLANNVARDIGVRVSMVEVLDCENLVSLASAICERGAR